MKTFPSSVLIPHSTHSRLNMSKVLKWFSISLIGFILDGWSCEADKNMKCVLDESATVVCATWSYWIYIQPDFVGMALLLFHQYFHIFNTWENVFLRNCDFIFHSVDLPTFNKRRSDRMCVCVMQAGWNFYTYWLAVQI